MITRIAVPIWGVLPPGVCIEFDTVIRFDPDLRKPRIRVQAGRRVISMAHYFMHGMKWRPAEVDLLMAAISDMNRV